MKWSWKLGTIAGIGLYVHATFLILILWIGVGSWMRNESARGVFEDIAFILALFGCVVLHELGHALAARRYQIATRDITLLPIGGVARLERMPEKPRQELAVALAGPAVNAVIAAGLWAGLLLGGGGAWPLEVDVLGGAFVPRLLAFNLFIAGFNLLPAFPMDGGRALRALLATRKSYVAATRIAAEVGQMMALAFGLLGLLGNPILIFIAFFVWIGAAAEAGLVEMRAAIAGIPVADAMMRDFATLAPEDSLDRAIVLTLRGSQKDFPVVERGELRGLLTQSQLLAALERGGRSTSVGSLCSSELAAVDSHEMLDRVMERLGTSTPTLPVTRGGRLVGLLSLENVSEWIRIEAAVGKSDPRAQRLVPDRQPKTAA